MKADGTLELISDAGGGPNGLAVGPDGALYLCNNGGVDWHTLEDGRTLPARWHEDAPGRIERIDITTGAVRTLYESCGDFALNSPNDIVFDCEGGFYFTDFGKTRSRGRDHGGVYYALPDGSSIKQLVYPINMANGIGLSPDGRTLYVAETEAARLWAYDVEGPGKIKRDPQSPHGGRLVYGAGGYQRFDSLAVDSAGNICVGTLINGGITIISPTGDKVEHVTFPDSNVTNICFGGPDYRTAFLTLSTTGRLAAVEWSTPGLKLAYEA